MGKKIEPTYLGDGVYATEDDRGIVLTTGSHVLTEADNVVVLEPKVWAALRKWAGPSPEEVELERRLRAEMRAHDDFGI
jgi:hypothetical protein